MADDASIEEIAGKHEPAEHGVEHVDRNSVGLALAEPGADVTKIGQEVTIYALASVERSSVFAKERPGFDCKKELGDRGDQMFEGRN